MSANLYVLLFSLYWAQGLPVGFMTHALPVLLRMEGVSLAQIGGFGLLMLPWAIKALWAPWVDYFGHFRRWIIITQILSLMFLLCLAYLPIGDLQQSKQLWLFFLVLFLLNTAGATQDIATDGLAVKLLKQQQQHWGNMLQVVGSRLGFIVGGGALLWLMDDLHWKNSFLLLALLVLLNSLSILFARMSQSEVTAKATFHFDMATCRTYLQYFSQHAELRMWLWVLLSFKLADGLFAPMSKTIMVDLGLSLKQIGLYISMLGAVCALIGSVIAGWALGYLKRDQALLGFSLLKLLSLCSMAWLAAQVHAQVTIQPWLIYVLHAVEECCSALLLVVMLTLIMQYCRTEYASTDFTIQVSLMALVSGVGYVFGGAITQYLGYVGMIILVILIGFLNLLMINKWKSRFLTLKF